MSKPRQVLTDCYECDGKWWFTIGQEVADTGWEGVELSPSEAVTVLAALKAAVDDYLKGLARRQVLQEGGTL